MLASGTQANRSDSSPCGGHCLLGKRDDETNAQTNLITNCKKFNEVMKGNNDGIGIMKEIGVFTKALS